MPHGQPRDRPRAAPRPHDVVQEAELCVIGAGSGGLSVAAGTVQMAEAIRSGARFRVNGDEPGIDCANMHAPVHGAIASSLAPYPTMSEISKRVAESFYMPKSLGHRTRGLVGLVQRLLP